MPRGINQYDEARLQGRLWTPNIILPNIVCWFDPSDFLYVVLATGVKQLTDKSGKGRNLSQAVDSSQPTYGRYINNMPCCLFNGTSHFMATNTSFSVTSPFKEFWVGQLVSTGNVTKHFTNSANGVNIAFYDYNGANAFSIFQGGGYPPTTTVSPGVGNNFIIEAYFNTITSRMSLNGSRTATFTAGSTTPTRTGVQIGRWAGDTTSLPNFVMGEYLETTNVSDNVSRIIEGYLAWKWGLTANLIAGHPFRNRPPLIGD